MNAMIGNSLLLGGEGYQISRSVRLRSSASAYLDRTMTASFTSQRIFTFSFWCKRGTLSGATQTIFDRNQSTNVNQFTLGFSPDDTFGVAARTSGTSTVSLQLITSGVFRDPSAWYHFVIAVDNTQATLSNRGKIYVNGVLQSLGTQTATQNVNYHLLTGLTYNIGRTALGSTNYVDGYLTEFNFIDGQQLDPSSFGETNSVTGVWQPKKYTGTYGNNGFYLNFSDNSAATAAAIGKDYSGNGNNWTPNNISVTAGATYDSMIDVPTQWADGGNGRGNYATLNPNAPAPGSTLITEANLAWAQTATNLNRAAIATFGMSSGKWYWEYSVGTSIGANNSIYIGIAQEGFALTNYCGATTTSWGYTSGSGNKVTNGSGSAYGATFTSNDVIGFAFDADVGTITAYKNGTSQGTMFSGLTSGPYFPVVSESIGTGGTTSLARRVNFGQRPFSYTPPTGFLALNTLNLPTPTILKGNQYFDATLWTGTGATLSVTNSGAMQPDLVWIKQRSAIRSNRLHDSVRGVSKQLFSDTTGAESSNTDELTAFNSNGFTLSTSVGVNSSAGTYVGWQWKEGATQGFDIVTYTGTGANRTIAHNLGVAPSMMIVKSRSSGTFSWAVYHASIGAGNYLTLNATTASTALAAMWNSTAPTSSVFSVGTDNWVNSNAATYVAYLFSEVAGFSKFGSYTGNGSADGPFVFLGFRPRFLLVKRTDTTANWFIADSSRSTYNVVMDEIKPNSSDAEVSTTTDFDFLSSGFKLRLTAAGLNASGGTYIFAAFAENPFKNALAR